MQQVSSAGQPTFPPLAADTPFSLHRPIARTLSGGLYSLHRRELLLHRPLQAHVKASTASWYGLPAAAPISLARPSVTKGRIVPPTRASTQPNACILGGQISPVAESEAGGSRCRGDIRHDCLRTSLARLRAGVRLVSNDGGTTPGSLGSRSPIESTPEIPLNMENLYLAGAPTARRGRSRASEPGWKHELGAIRPGDARHRCARSRR